MPPVDGVAAVGNRRYAVPPMDDRYCDNCGYELLGLPMSGKCPECGHPYGLGAARDRRLPLLVRHGFSLGLAILAGMILTCGGVMSIWSTKPVQLVATTLVIFVVFGTGAVLIFLNEKKSGR